MTDSNDETFDLAPTLKGETLELRPLAPADFEALYAVAADPLVWEQHPERERFRRDVFEKFFRKAIAGGSAFLVTDRTTGAVLGSTRFYDYAPEKREIAIGYTFLSRACWGGPVNLEMKTLLLTHAFGFVDSVVFHVGSENHRSRKALEKIGVHFESEAEGKCTYRIRKT